MSVCVDYEGMMDIMIQVQMRAWSIMNGMCVYVRVCRL